MTDVQPCRRLEYELRQLRSECDCPDCHREAEHSAPAPPDRMPSRELVHRANTQLEEAHAAVLDGDDAAALAGIETALRLTGTLTYALDDEARTTRSAESL